MNVRDALARLIEAAEEADCGESRWEKRLADAKAALECYDELEFRVAEKTRYEISCTRCGMVIADGVSPALAIHEANRLIGKGRAVMGPLGPMCEACWGKSQS